MPIRVLHVDDDEAFVDLGEEYLGRAEDVAVLTATSVEAGLARLGEEPVDCVVSDHEMPDRTGLQFLEAVRADHGDLPFVLFTGKGSEEIASDAISAGVTDYVRKGGGEQFDLLENTVRNAVERYRAQRELRRTHDRLAGLHECAHDLSDAVDVEAVYELGVACASAVLDFEVCGIYVVEDGRFVPKGDSYWPESGTASTEEGVIGKTYRTGRSYLVRDAVADATADPDRPTFRSGVSVPIDDVGAFQAIAGEPDFYDEVDLELAELLVTHVEQALDRVD